MMEFHVHKEPSLMNYTSKLTSNNFTPNDDKNTTINRLRCLLNSEKHAYKMNSSRQLIPWRAV